MLLNYFSLSTFQIVNSCNELQVGILRQRDLPKSLQIAACGVILEDKIFFLVTADNSVHF